RVYLWSFPLAPYLELAGGGGRSAIEVDGHQVASSQLIDRLTGRGYDVTIKTDMEVRAADATGKAAVLLSASTTLARVMASFPELPTLTTPVLAMDENLEPFLN